MSTAAIRRAMIPGPGTKSRKTPAAAIKMPDASHNAFRVALLLNLCRSRNCCWNLRPGKPVLKRRQFCFRCVSIWTSRN